VVDALVAAVRLERRQFALDVAIEVPPGTTLAVVGPSGAGKSTLLRLVAGLERPDAGGVVLGDAIWSDVARGRFVPPERRSVGLVFQDAVLFPHLTAAANVAFPLAAAGLSRRERRVRVAALLDRVGASALAEARPAALSGGERQRVAIARALARDPRVLLLDEPLSALDDAARDDLLAVLRDALRGLTGILVTHRLDDARALGSAGTVVLREGRLADYGA
jgi:molybdate transport system ATP-binding protein